MPAPNVFVSSTFYDLRYIRENLEFFVRSLGYNAILSERGAIYYNPDRDAASSAVAEVANCQIYVLVIGGRFGSEFPDASQSVTNEEYKEAIRHKVPVFALVEHGVLADYQVWQANRERGDEQGPIIYPNVDDERVFEFIDEVRTQSVNNALFPFRDFEDIQTYLRRQWAGMLYSFLLSRNQTERVEETLNALEMVGRRVEVLSKGILESVGSAEAKATAEMYDLMLGSSAVQDMSRLGLRPTPQDILQSEDFLECTERLGGVWEVQPEDADVDYNTSYSAGEGKMSFFYAKGVRRDYEELREKLQAIADRLSEASS